jgi:hypothetical protein
MFSPRTALEPQRVVFLATLLAVAGSFFVFAVFAGRRLLLSGHMFPPDVLFGFDIDRTIRGIADPNFYYDRSNVHPLFTTLLRPFARLVRSLGITVGMAAIIVNAAAGAWGLLATAWYLRLRAAARLDVCLATLTMASGTTWMFQSALPSTPIFSMLFIALIHVLLVETLRRPPAALSSLARKGREALWVVAGIANYGLAVSNGLMAFFDYGFGRLTRPWWRAWLRAAAYGAIVLAAGYFCAWRAGAYLNFWREVYWLVPTPYSGTPSAWPLLQSLATSLAWTAVSPIPHVGPTQDDRQWLILAFNEWRFTPLGWILISTWIVLLILALRAVWKDRTPQAWRLNAALISGLAFHVLLHRWYVFAYEGSFMWNGHSYFMVIGLFASLLARGPSWPAGRRRALRLILLLLSLGLIVHNGHLLWSVGSLVPLPPGYRPVVP